jgi:hypothetical protein
LYVLIGDGVYIVAGHNTSVAKEVKHFMKVADCELRRGGFKGGEAVIDVGGRTVESSAA